MMSGAKRDGVAIFGLSAHSLAACVINMGGFDLPVASALVRKQAGTTPEPLQERGASLPRIRSVRVLAPRAKGGTGKHQKMPSERINGTSGSM